VNRLREILDMQQKLLPDLLDVLKKRFNVLQHILLLGTVGRRTLARSLHMTERVLRSEIDFLRAQGLLDSHAAGMRLTDSGLRLIAELEPIIHELLGLKALQEKLRAAFQLKQVLIVPGDADRSELAKKELCRMGSIALRDHAQKVEVIAVTGGSTMAELAQFLVPATGLRGKWFVPARGGLGESVELQANSIVSMMAKRTGGQYRLLHVPDHLSEEAYMSLIHEPQVKDVLRVIRQAKMVVHGIGDALVMAERRKLADDELQRLRQDGALAESFGYYFDRNGRVLHQMPTVGLHLEDIQQMETVIAVAGGRSKAHAIEAIMRFGQTDILVTDEGAAQAIVAHISDELVIADGPRVTSS
jgi:central glycolytic genes regulator